MTSPEFVWTDEECSLANFVETCPELPQIVCVRDGFDDEEALHSFASDEVYVIRSVEAQTRVVVRDRAHRLLSIPLEYPLYLHVVHKDRKAITQVQRPKLLKQIIRRIANQEIRDNHVVFQENHAVKVQSAPGSSYETKCEVLEIVDVHQLTYLVGNSLINDSLYPSTAVIPTYLPIHIGIAVNLLKSGDNRGLVEYLAALLEDIPEVLDEEELNSLFNKDIMVVSDDEIDIPADSSTEDSLKRVIGSTKELNLSLNAMDPSSQRRSLGKRISMDRMSLPPPPPPPIPELGKPSAVSSNSRPRTLHIPTVPESEAPPADRDQMPLPSRRHGPHKIHFNFHSLLPSAGNFPSLERIKKKVRKKAGKLRNYHLTRDDSFIKSRSSTSDLLPLDTPAGRTVTYLSDCDDDQWSDDSFDSDDGLPDSKWRDDAVKQVPSSEDGGKSTYTKAPKVEDFTTELLSKLKVCMDDKTAPVSNPVTSDPITHCDTDPPSNNARAVTGISPLPLNDGTVEHDSKPAVSMGNAKPSLPFKPKGHLQRLSCEVGNHASSPKKETPSNPLKISQSGKVSTGSPEIVMRSKAATPLSDSKPSPPPKPRGKNMAGKSENVTGVIKNDGLGAQTPRKSTTVFDKHSSLAKVNTPSTKPVISQKPKRYSNFRTEEPHADFQAMKNIFEKADNNILRPVPTDSSVRPDSAKIAEVKKKIDLNDYADIDLLPSRGEVVAAVSGENFYDEVYHLIPTKHSDRSAGDGAETVKESGQSDGKKRTATLSNVTATNQSAALSPPVAPSTQLRKPLQLDSVADLYATPLSMKQRKLAVALSSSNDVDHVDTTLSIEKQPKYSSLAEVPTALAQLSVQDVIECLALLKMSQHRQQFADNEIDGELLADLDENILQNMFSLSPFNAKKLVKFVSGWRPKLL